METAGGTNNITHLIHAGTLKDKFRILHLKPCFKIYFIRNDLKTGL